MSTHHHTRHFNLGSGDWPQLHILPRCALYRLIPIPSPKCSVLGNTKMSNSRKQRSGWINIHVPPWNQPCIQNPLKTSPTYELKSSFIRSPHAHPVASTPEPRRNNCGSLSSCLNFLHSLTLPIKAHHGFDGSSWLKIEFWPSAFESLEPTYTTSLMSMSIWNPGPWASSDFSPGMMCSGSPCSDWLPSIPAGPKQGV